MVGVCISMAVLASAYMCGSRRCYRTTLQRTDASRMNATDVMLAEPGTAQSGSMIDEAVADAPPVSCFDYARVVEALPGTPYMLTIAAQLAAILRARIRSGELAPNQPVPGESTLMRRYGVARETAREAVGALVAERLVYVVQGRGACVAAHH
jgi:hypothetical protein